MGNILVSWRTSLTGIGAILAAIADIIHSLAVGTPVNWNVDIPAIIGGIGLMAAKDGNVSNSPTPLPKAEVVSPGK